LGFDITAFGTVENVEVMEGDDALDVVGA